MSFPLTIGTREITTAPHLARAVVEDARQGGGTVVAGQPPSRWVLGLVEEGLLTRELAVGLAAALLRHTVSAAVAEGARLAAGLQAPELAPVLAAAAAGHDVGLLLDHDPLHPGQSVEDALLRAMAAFASHLEAGGRADLLQRLRHAGLVAEELGVLLEVGSPGELREWAPAVLVEGLPDEAVRGLAAVLAAGGDRAEAVCDGLRDLPTGRRAEVWSVLAQAAPDLDPSWGERVLAGPGEADQG